LHIVDWLIFFVLLTILIGCGFFLKRFVRSVADFLVAGRKTRKFLGLSTNTAEGMGLVSIAASAQQGFQYGFAYIWISVIQMLYSIPLFGIFGFAIKRFRASKCMTVPQYIEERYRNKGLRVLIGFVMAISGILNMAIFPKVSGSFLIIFTGLPETFQFAGTKCSTLAVVMILLISLAVLFTFLGGMVTVLVTDFIQSVILVATLIFVGFFTVAKVGVGNIHEALQSNLGQSAYNPFGSGSYGFVWVLWVTLLTICTKLSFAPVIQKMASTDSPETTRKMDLLSIIFGSGMRCYTLLIGIGALALLGSTVPSGVNAEDYNRFVAALYLKQALGPIMMGVALSAFVFASISTDDSYLLAWSAVIINDIIMPLRKKIFSPEAHILAVRITIISIAVLIFLWGTYYTAHESILEYMYMTGTIFAGIGMSVIFGLYWKRATAAGAYAAVVTCTVIPLADLLTKQFVDNYPLTTQQSGLYALLGGIMMMVIVSLITCRKQSSGWVDYGKVVKQMDTEEKMMKLAKREQKNE
jgi:solute:Na+ symporter, SSS family